MSRAQTFAEKAAKMAKREAEVACPVCNKNAKMVYAKMVNSVKTDKNTWKFLERNVRLCSNCLAEV